MRGLLTLMMLLAAYSFASIDEVTEYPSVNDQYVSENIVEGTVVDFRDDGSSTYNIIYLRSGNLEWVIRYFDHNKNSDSGLIGLREIAARKANIRVVLDCIDVEFLALKTATQGRGVRNIDINPNNNVTCQIQSSTLL